MLQMVSNSLLDNAGAFALSLIPVLTTPIAYRYSFPARLFWRMVGIVAVFVGLPFAWLESLFGYPMAGIFFAQKPRA